MRRSSAEADPHYTRSAGKGHRDEGKGGKGHSQLLPPAAHRQSK